MTYCKKRTCSECGAEKAKSRFPSVNSTVCGLCLKSRKPTKRQRQSEREAQQKAEIAAQAKALAKSKAVCVSCGKEKVMELFTFTRDITNGTKVYGSRCQQCHNELIEKAAKHRATLPEPAKKAEKVSLKVTRRNGKFEPLVGGM